MASKVTFAGRTTSTPSALTEVDASALEPIGIAAQGTVALIGESVGGVPVNAITDVEEIDRLTDSASLLAIYESGPLKEAGLLCFNPSKDPQIRGGARELIALRVGQSTQATESLDNASGNVVDLTSVRYGAEANLVNVQISTGTTKGKRVDIGYDNLSDSQDDVGGGVFSVTYVDGTSGWETAALYVNQTGKIGAYVTRTDIEGVTQALANAFCDGRVGVSHSSTASNTVSITGVLANGTSATETLTLTGTASVPVYSTNSYKQITSWTTSATAGTFTLHANGFVTDPDVHDTVNKVVNYINQKQQEEAGDTVGFVATYVDPTWSSEDPASLDEQAGTNIFDTEVEVTGTVQSVLDYLNTSRFVTAEASALTRHVVSVTVGSATNSTRSSFSVDGIYTSYVSDTSAAADEIVEGQVAILAYAPGISLIVSAASDLDNDKIILTSLRGDADFVVANRAGDYTAQTTVTNGSGKRSAPSNATVFLSGGTTVAATSADYDTALTLLREMQVNTIVPLTSDPSVHAACEAHCEYMSTRQERDCVVGLSALDGNGEPTGVLPTKASIKEQIVAIGSRHVRAVAQEVSVFDSAGTKVWREAPYLAAMVAGMQAAAPVTLPLTHKYMRTLAVRQDSSWSPIVNSDEMINAGLWFLANVRGKGQRNVRDITTYLLSDNLAFSEASVNRNLNAFTYDFRTELEQGVGQRGLPESTVVLKQRAAALLDEYKSPRVRRLVAWRSLTITKISDANYVEVEIAPAIPDNFILAKIRVVDEPRTV